MSTIAFPNISPCACALPMSDLTHTHTPVKFSFPSAAFLRPAASATRTTRQPGPTMSFTVEERGNPNTLNYRIFFSKWIVSGNVKLFRFLAPWWMKRSASSLAAAPTCHCLFIYCCIFPWSPTCIYAVARYNLHTVFPLFRLSTS